MADVRQTKQPTIMHISSKITRTLTLFILLQLTMRGVLGKELANVVITFNSSGSAAIGNFSSDSIFIEGRTEGSGFRYSYSAVKHIGAIIEGEWESFFAWDWCGTGRKYGTREIPSGHTYEFPEPYHLAKGQVKIEFSYTQKLVVYSSGFEFKNEYGPEILTLTEASMRQKEEEERKASALKAELQDSLVTLNKIVSISDLVRRKDRLMNYVKVLKEYGSPNLDQARRLAEGELDLVEDLMKKGYTHFPTVKREQGKLNETTQ